MQLHQHQRTQSQRSHLTLDQSPRSTPIPGSLSMQDHFNISQGNSGSNNDYTFKYINSKLSFNDSSSLQKTLQSPVFDKHHNSLPDPPTPTNQTNSISIDEFYYNASKNSSSNYNKNNNSNNNNNNHNNSLYQQQLRRHLHHKSTSDTNGSVNEIYLQTSDLASMTTDDEVSSTASFRQRSRKLSKAGSIPSPLSASSSFSTVKNASSNALSLISTAERANTTNSTVDTKTSSQLRVRHLEQHSSYAGYLTKFSSRTFFSRKQWKRRYFILSETTLYCFKSSDPQHPLLESIVLSPEAIVCVTDIFSGKRFCIEISCPGEKSWYILADTAPEMSGWLKELKNTVHNIRNIQHGTRSETLYSESSELSDFSNVSAVKLPSVPVIPSQYEYSNGASRSLPGTLSSTSSSLSRQVQQAKFESQKQQQQQQQQQHNLDFYPSQVASLNPPPRSITPKPSTPTPGPSPQNSSGSSNIHSYRASMLSLSQQPQQPQQPQQQQQQQHQSETRRRRNSSLSTGQPSSDYASFGAVMQRAEAMAEAQKESPSSTWSIPTKAELQEGNYATLPRSKRESTMSASNATITSTMPSVILRNQAVSTMTGRPESAIIPNRNVQRLAASSSRPMSSISPRPLSPTFSRSSPRNSLVIAPPPRSALRPASVSIRHSTQILPPPQIVTAGLPSQFPNSPLSSSPPTSSLPATPDSDGYSNQAGSLSRITSIRHQRDPVFNRHSMISTTSTLSGFSSGMGSIQERVQRSSSRAGGIRSSSVSSVGTTTKPAVPSDLLNMNSPLSPSPSLAAAPTLPLPEPPGSVSGSSSSMAGPTHSTPPVSSSSSSATDLSSQNPSVPRHHEPDLPIPNRSKARARSQSQEATLISSKLEDLQLSHAANNTPAPKSGTSSINSVGNNNGHKSKQMSLPIHTMYVLPEPPTGQVPAQPSRQASSSHPRKSSGSGTALRPISSSMNNVASLGGGIARKPSATNTPAITASASKRDSVVSPRLSALISLPPGPTTAMPLPPKSALPAPPTSALPKKPAGTDKKPETRKLKAGQINSQAGFDVILEEEDEDEDDSNEIDEDDDDGEEYESHLQFEELEAAKAATEQELDPESTATTPTTATRPEYYATKERKVVEYIFPSEAFSV